MRKKNQLWAKYPASTTVAGDRVGFTLVELLVVELLVVVAIIGILVGLSSSRHRKRLGKCSVTTTCSNMDW